MSTQQIGQIPSYRVDQPQPATNSNANLSLKSIAQHSPAPPLRKIRALALLLFDSTTDRFVDGLKVSKQHFTEVVQGRRTSKDLCQRIASAFGLEVSDIWPSAENVVDFGSTHRKSRSIR